MLKQAVVLCALVVLASAFVEYMPLGPIPEKFNGQEGCYLSYLDIVVPFDSSTPVERGCHVYHCTKKYIAIDSCGEKHPEPPCIGADGKMKPYPDCCCPK